MNNPNQTDTTAYQEIGLVDLAAILWFRRYIALSIFIVTVLAGLVYVGVAKNQYQYVSLYQVAGMADGEFIEDPDVTVLALEQRWVPELIETQGSEAQVFTVAFDVQKKAGTIRLLTEASEAQSEHVEKLHRTLLSKLINHQSALVKEKESQLRKHISANEELMAEVRSTGDRVGSALEVVLEKQMDLRAELDSLRAGSTLVVARQSQQPTVPDRIFIVVFSVFLGFALGLIFAFLMEFTSNVAKRYRVMVQGR